MGEGSGSRRWELMVQSDDFAHRVARIRHAAHGRVLEIGAGSSGGSAQGQYDTVISLARLFDEPDPAGYVNQLVAHLAPTGTVWMLEPTTGTGQWGRRPRFRRRRDQGSDVPALLRSAGLFVTDLDRFVVTSLPGRTVQFVDAVARFPTVAPDTNPAEGIS